MGQIRSWTAVLALVTALLPTVAPRAEDGAREEVQWVERPSAADLERLAPAEARLARVEGRVTLECMVMRSGRLQSCVVKSETPAGMGFAAAALRAAPLYRLAAKSADVDVEGSQIAFTLRFRFAEPSLAAGSAAAPQDPARAASSTTRPMAQVSGLPAEIARLTPPGRLMRLGVVPGWQVDFMDLDRVTRTGDMVDVIRLTVYSPTPAAGDRQGQFDVWGLRFDCRTNAYTVTGIQTYGPDGAAVRWEPGSREIQTSQTGSVYDAMADIACQKGAPARLDAGSTAEALDAARKLLGGG